MNLICITIIIYEVKFFDKNVLNAIKKYDIFMNN